MEGLYGQELRVVFSYQLVRARGVSFVIVGVEEFEGDWKRI